MSEGPLDPSEQTTLLGVAPRRGALNKFPLWQYVLIAMVVGVGAMYAAPNLFQPDPAIQVRALDSDQLINQGTLTLVEAALKKNNIQIIDSMLEDDSLVVRVGSDEAQLRAQATKGRSQAAGRNSCKWTVFVSSFTRAMVARGADSAETVC